ncbi:MAG: DUF1351 domain-containing protein [Bacilli bacterium]
MKNEKLELVLKMDKGNIVNNAETLKKMLSEKGNKYNYIVNEENYDVAKTDRASLNKLATLITDKRIQFEKDLVKDWTPIKSDLMDCERIIKKISSDLVIGINEVEYEKEKEKLEQIITEFNSYELNNCVDFNLIFDKKWLNVSTSKAKWKKELEEKVKKINQDLVMIKLFLPQDEVEQEQVKFVYFNTLDIGLAKAKADELVGLRNKVAQNKQNEAVGHNNEAINEVIEQVDHAQEKQAEQEQELELFTRTFRIIDCTRQQVIDLGKYMNMNGIAFEKVELK